MVGTDQMMSEVYKPEWRSICESVKGASHARSGRPNQDAISSYPTEGNSLPLIVAVSDGHGSAKYFRSDKGAFFATASAIDSLSRFQEELANFSISSRMEFEEHLTKSLVNTWRSDVNAHLKSEPFLNEELRLLEEQEGPAARQAVQDNSVLAYGATILAVMITESYIAYLQLGDGDILTVSEEGQTSKVFPKNRKHFANETTSLCAGDA
jgi:serine/threonine protein phosphatase PrpC